MRAVLLDFSGTLFRLEHDETWLAGATDVDGNPVDVEAQTEIMRRMTAPSQQAVALGPEYEYAWENRDLDPELHRKVYLAVLRGAGASEDVAEKLYGGLVDPARWTPYPDTTEVLHGLRDNGIPVAVISNIAFDIRPAFQRVGVYDLVDEYFLSYLEGMIKPEPKLFLRACERLGVAPEDALMIGDSVEADGGAAEVGCQVEIVDPLPTAERPDALLSALRRSGAL